MSSLTPQEIQQIAKEAYIYGFPMVVNYKTMYFYAVLPESPEYKGGFNNLKSEARVYTPEDKAVVTPNSDTPYGMGWFDLRAEPFVMHVPEMEPERFYQVQLIDLFTHNYAYISTTATGNQPGNYLLTGPGWEGDVPADIRAVIPSETSLIFMVVRTQLFNPEDLARVQEIQQGYKLEPLSAYAGTPAPPAATEITFPAWVEGSQFDARALNYIDFMLGLTERHHSEAAMFERFGQIGLGTGESFEIEKVDPETREALEAGVKDGFTAMETVVATLISDPLSSGKIFGTREFLTQSAQNFGLDKLWLLRMAGAHLGLYGNSGAEALYPTYQTDADGEPLNASKHNYALTFPKGKLPPVKAFWSLTMYDGKTQLLVDNPLDRYLLNSPMMEQFTLNEDGSLTLLIQRDHPGPEKESNWLPAPDGPFYLVLRLYGPEKQVLVGQWQHPPLQKA
jgi:hypothetical protein